MRKGILIALLSAAVGGLTAYAVVKSVDIEGGQAVQLSDGAQFRTATLMGTANDSCVLAGDGRDLEIAFNCKYLLNSVRAADSEELLITMKAPTQSITIEPKEKNEDDDFFYMILPVRMHE